MPSLNVSITRFVDPSPPGYVECSFSDVHGRTWTIQAKVSTVTKASLNERSSYPQPGTIPCEIMISWLDVTGREVVTINTATHHVQAVSGETTFDVFGSQLSGARSA